jgi:predicted PurR-regulated permease PerM
MMSKPAISALALALGLCLLFVLAPEVPLTVFAAAVLAVALRAGGAAIGQRFHVSEGRATAVLAVAILAVVVTGFAFGATSLALQAEGLRETVPRGVTALRHTIEGLPGGAQLLRLASEEVGTLAALAGRMGLATLDALGALAAVVVVAAFLAASPGAYQSGLVRLLAPPLRPAAWEGLRAAGKGLRGFLWAKGIGMSLVGFAIGLGLWLLGVPYAAVLGLIAGLCEFVPYIGWLVAAAPALLVALTQDVPTMLWVAGLYVAVQAVQSNLGEPLLEQEGSGLPPVLTLAAQLLMGVLFGVAGVILATPLAAVIYVVVRRLYVERWLEGSDSPAVAAAAPRPAGRAEAAE